MAVRPPDAFSLGVTRSCRRLTRRNARLSISRDFEISHARAFNVVFCFSSFVFVVFVFVFVFVFVLLKFALKFESFEICVFSFGVANFSTTQKRRALTRWRARGLRAHLYTEATHSPEGVANALPCNRCEQTEQYTSGNQTLSRVVSSHRPWVVNLSLGYDWYPSETSWVREGR